MNSEESSGNKVKSIPFDEKKHELALKSGHMDYVTATDGNAIFIKHRQSNAKGSGFGVASMRHIVEESINRGFDGNVYSDTAWSSHIFHLYMGMIPSTENNRLYVLSKYGQGGGSTLYNFLTNNPLKPSDLRVLDRILKREKMVSADTVVTLDVAMQHFDAIKALTERKTCHAQEIIPQLIRTLKSNVDKKFPDTTNWDNVFMHLSDEGRARWKEAITNKTEFVQFKNFEQFRPFCTADQIKELDEAIRMRNERLAEMAANPEKKEEAPTINPTARPTTTGRMSAAEIAEKQASMAAQTTTNTSATTLSTAQVKPPKPELPPKPTTFTSDHADTGQTKNPPRTIAPPVATGSGNFRSETTVSVKKSVQTSYKERLSTTRDKLKSTESGENDMAPKLESPTKK